jgi:hypothetical protein
MLEGTYLPRNHEWPRGWLDFDRLWPTTDLVLRADTEARSEWSPRWTNNLIGLGASLVALVVGAVAWFQREPLLGAFEAASSGVQLIAWGFAAAWALVTLLCLAMACFRARLVIDRQRGELRVETWGRARQTVPLSAVRLLSHENVRHVDNDDGTMFAHELRPVLVMELRDGTLIRVTAGRPEIMRELRLQITDAHDQWCGGHQATDSQRSPGGGGQELGHALGQALAQELEQVLVQEFEQELGHALGPTLKQAHEPELGLPFQEREATLAALMPSICRECFPDDGDALWRVVAMDHQGALSTVEMSPAGQGLGYERFRFVFECSAERAPLLRACFVHQERWSLLFGVDPGVDFVSEAPVDVSASRRS